MRLSSSSRGRRWAVRVARVTPRHRLRRAWILTLGLLACGDTPTGVRAVQFASSLGVDIATFTETPSGLFYKDTRQGEGQAAATGSFVAFFIQGWYADGTELQRRIELTTVQ